MYLWLCRQLLDLEVAAFQQVTIASADFLINRVAEY
jgi:hypothetical protein